MGVCLCGLAADRRGGGGSGNRPRAQIGQRLHFLHNVNTIANQIGISIILILLNNY